MPLARHYQIDCAAVSDSLPFGTRLWFAFVCFFRVLFDGAFATRAFAAREPAAESEALPPPPPPAPKKKPKPEKADVTPALQLLGLLQREGRFIDFVQQDVAGFSDNDIGAAARVVHEGCRKALRAHTGIEPVRSEEEGGQVTLDDDFDRALVKLTGNVAGKAPYRGILRHKGWRATRIELPASVAGHDAHVLAQAEVEL